ncbi:MAG: peptidylprolyl isomerase [Planctomycetes bacterium]|nr:peptidylprolyl isomerase [Planctomycetota bacterium]
MLNLAILPIVAAVAMAEDLSAAIASADRIAAARVDGAPIYVHEVQRLIERVLGRRKVTPEARPVLEAETLEQLVKRRLILKFLEKRNLAASREDLEAEVSRIKRQLAQQGTTLEEYLQRTGQTRGDLEQTLLWEQTWRRYLERNLSEENLERYFQSRRREFDGTELRVAHILIKPAVADDPESLTAAVQQAEQIRGQIAAGAVDFAAAAREHSASPTAEQGGDIGFLGRKAPMPEPFSKAAFALKPGEVSPPVVTPFGAHLIQVLEAKPGDKTWRDVRGELEQAVTQYLFDWVATQQRPHSQVEYTGAAPHFEPGTKKLNPSAATR